MVSSASYLPFGPATGWTLGNGLTVTRQFDSDYRLTDLVTSPVMDITYAYDLVDRLTDASGLYGEQAYTYDLVGNRLGKTQTNGSTTTDTYSYALTSNRLTDINGSTSQVITYDATGNIISRGNDTFTYNARNRLSEVKRNGTTLATYKHNGKGERVSKTVHSPTGNATTYFVYDLASNIIAEADGTGVIIREYAYHNERLTMFTYGAANEIYYYHNDHMGTPKAVTDATAAIAWQGDYTPFGEVTETVSLIEQPFRFPGQYFDSETNLHYNYFRDYDPSIGRYIQSDPIGLNGGLNTYAYVVGNPIINFDPFGLSCWTDSYGQKVCDSGNPYGDRPFCPSGDCAAFPPKLPPESGCFIECKVVTAPVCALAGKAGARRGIRGWIAGYGSCQLITTIVCKEKCEKEEECEAE